MESTSSRLLQRVGGLFAAAILVAALLYSMRPIVPAAATTGADPYQVTVVEDVNPDPDIVETTLVAKEAMVDIGGGVMAHAQTFNGTIPGPEFQLTVGQRVIVHFKNELHHEPTGIHWHGIELANAYDGTPPTQNQVAPGDTFLYDFVVTRPGTFWYHPHHHHSTNQVFKGMYGSIVVTDPNEAALVANGTLPAVARTMVLSDTIVCKAPGSNPTTYDLSLPWAGGATLLTQAGPNPKTVCETPIDHDGEGSTVPLAAGEIPNIQQKINIRVNEGHTVLLNGMNAGGRAGSPSAPGPLDADAVPLFARAGEGLRFRFINAATTRFFRLRMTTASGTQIPLVRVGGQGGLLDAAVLEGTVAGGFDFKYDRGEILLDPGDRQEVVAAIPANATGDLTLWTLDFQRTGGSSGWATIPTVPVAHFRIISPVVSPAYAIADGTPLRSATGDPVEVLPAPDASLLVPPTFSPPKPGLDDPNIALTVSPLSINNVVGHHDFSVDYALQIPPDSTRYARLGNTLQLKVENTSLAHHPFHLHGFSIQPISLSGCDGLVTSFTFPRAEFVDNIDIPRKCTLTFRVHLEDRPMVDGFTPGGGLGRWMFHCHIFFHHHHGMVGEFIATGAGGNERPFVDADDPTVGVSEGSTALMEGTVHDPDGDLAGLSASIGTIVDNGDGTWSWSYVAPDGPINQFVYITATDSGGNVGQTAFIVQVSNLPPRPAIDPEQATTVAEGEDFNVLASFTDAGLDEAYTATIDFGEGSRDQPATVDMTHIRPAPQAGTVSGSWQYGDNGTFTVTVSVTDKDGATSTASFPVTVTNADPTATIENTSPIVGQLGQAVLLNGRVTDPGSDDITSTWSFGDGSADEVQLSLVNPPDPDELPSPTLQPRDVTHDVEHAYDAACAYQLNLSATDDDGGEGVDGAWVVVPADPSLSRGLGYWRNQFSVTGRTDPQAPLLACYLAITGVMSDVFDEARSVATAAEAHALLAAKAAGNPLVQLDRELLAAWLNFANGGVQLDEMLDVNGDGTADISFADLIAAAEQVRLDPTSTKQQLNAQRQLLQLVNERHGL